MPKSYTEKEVKGLVEAAFKDGQLNAVPRESIAIAATDIMPEGEGPGTYTLKAAGREVNYSRMGRGKVQASIDWLLYLGFPVDSVTFAPKET